MFCPRCKKLNQEDASYCPFCGLNFANWEIKLEKYGIIQLKGETEEKSDVLKSWEIRQNHPAEKDGHPLILQVWEQFSRGLFFPLGREKNEGTDSPSSSIAVLGTLVLFFGLASGFDLFLKDLRHTGDASFLVIWKRFLQSSFSFALFLGISGGLIYRVGKDVLKADMDPKQFLFQFSSFHSLSMVACLIFLLGLTVFPPLSSLFIGFFQGIQISIIIGLLGIYVPKAKRSIGPVYPGLFIWGILVILFEFLFGENIAILFL